MSDKSDQKHHKSVSQFGMSVRYPFDMREVVVAETMSIGVTFCKLLNFGATVRWNAILLPPWERKYCIGAMGVRNLIVCVLSEACIEE